VRRPHRARPGLDQGRRAGARHENEIGGTTDVAAHTELTSRRTTKVVDGTSVTGWFTEDFTWAELQTLRARERLPAVRPANTAFDGPYEIPSLQQVIDLAKRSRPCDGDKVGIYPETKHPSYFDGIGLSREEPLVRTLQRNGYRDERHPVIVQSFEVGNLKQLDRMTDVRLVPPTSAWAPIPTRSDDPNCLCSRAHLRVSKDRSGLPPGIPASLPTDRGEGGKKR